MSTTSGDLVPTTPGSLTLEHLEKTLGVYFVGYMFSMVLYGFTFFQTYMYYSRYPRDTWTIKGVVALLWAIDTAIASIFSQTLHHYLVAFFPFTRGTELATTPFCAQLQLSIIAVFIAQLFYAYNVWSAKRNSVMPVSIATLSSTAFALSTVSSILLFNNSEFVQMAVNPHKAITALAHALTTASAIVSFVALSTGPLPQGFKPIKTWFDSLVTYSITYGGLAIVIQLAYLFVFVGAPTRLYWLPFQVVAAKLFILGVMTFLNSRETASSSLSHPENDTKGELAWSVGGASRTLGGSRSRSTAGRNGSRGGSRIKDGNEDGMGVGVGEDTMSALEFSVKPIVIGVAHSIDGRRDLDMEGELQSGRGKSGYVTDDEFDRKHAY